MRFVVTLRDGSPAGTQTEVLVDASPDSSFAALLPQLLGALDDGTHPSFAPHVRVWVDGVPVTPDEHTLASAGLGPGAVVELHAPRERPAVTPTGIAEIRVVNGPGAGRVHRLSLGHTVVGYESPGMGLADRRVPARALTVLASAGGRVQVEPGTDGGPATLAGTPLKGRRAWPVDAALALGRSVLQLAPVSAAVPPAPRGLTVELARRPGGARPAPDPAGLLLAAIGRGPEVWSRFTAHDTLGLRLGLDPQDAPVTLDLLGTGVLGLAGDQPTARTVAGWLLAQCVTLYGPDQVRVGVLTSPAYRSRLSWEWLVRVPHADPGSVATAPDDPEPPYVAMIGTDDESAGRRIAELTALAADRRLVASTATGPAEGPRIVVVLDGARAARDRPGVCDLLTYGPAAGIHLVCLEDDEHHLPESCTEVITCSPDELRLRSGAPVRPDLVEPAWTDRLSRALARLRSSAGAETPALGFELPGPPGLDGMLGVDLDPPSARAVMDGWASSPSSRAVVGAGQEGPFAVDLRLDGPHLLLAGAPDAGPDDLVRLVLTALAVGNRPDHLGLVLIGPRRHFGDCVRLPHVAGTVDPSERGGVANLRRAVLAIGAALDRMAGVDDLAAGPRLVLAVHDVVDLCRDHPEAMAGLVDLAGRPGPLGPNLVLGTASPERIGTVDVASALCATAAERLCLRVGDEAGSRAVIDTTEAARIPRRATGTGYARAGHWPLLAFRAPVGRGGPRATDSSGPPVAWPLAWDDVGHRVPARPTTTTAGGALGDDVGRLVSAVRVAAESLRVPPPAAPWLPPLPDVVTVDGLDAPAGDPVTGPHPWALADAPAEQERVPVGLDLAHARHLLLIGRSGSGRTTALRTLAGVLAERVSSSDLHLYLLDTGGGLAPAAGLPQTGTLLTGTDPEPARRVLGALAEEVARRREVLVAGGWTGLDEQRAAVAGDDRLPYLLLMVDRWDLLTASPLGATVAEQTLLLLRRGGAAGLHVVLSGDRSLLQGRISALSIPRLMLRPDRVDCRLAGLDPAHLPERLPPGRGLWGETGAETQVAVLSADPSPAAQERALTDIARRRARRNAAVPTPQRPRPF